MMHAPIGKNTALAVSKTHHNQTPNFDEKIKLLQ